ncbi:hypothetical protein AMR47_19505 [Leptospira interrogans]|nr:hypothetical protein AMR47_19505 [Leptospira interrogans]
MKLIFTHFKDLRQVKNRTISHLKNIFEGHGTIVNQQNKSYSNSPKLKFYDSGSTLKNYIFYSQFLPISLLTKL